MQQTSVMAFYLRQSQPTTVATTTSKSTEKWPVNQSIPVTSLSVVITPSVITSPSVTSPSVTSSSGVTSSSVVEQKPLTVIKPAQTAAGGFHKSQVNLSNTEVLFPTMML